MECYSLLGDCGVRRLARLLVCASLGLIFAGQAKAQPQPYYLNDTTAQYYTPFTAGQTPPPNIDATAFDNEGIFEVSFGLTSYKTLFYEMSDTLFITNGNSGLMIVNAPLATNLLTGNILAGDAYGAGFQFDDDSTTTGRGPAGTFYNAGTIRCNSIIDGNNTFNFGGIFGLFTVLSSIGQCNISATNVYNPGDIDLGVDSVLQIAGQNVDLSRSSLTIESTLPTFFGINTFFNSPYFNNVNLASTYAIGTDTNNDWDPQEQLLPTQAESSEPVLMFITNSAAYFDIRQPNPSNNIVRAVFVENNSPNAPYNVYIDDPNGGSQVDPFASGTAHVEWVGSYTDPVSGNSVTNYLYLTDDYALGASTNVLAINGVPDNFSFIQSPTKLLFNPVPVGYQNAFLAGTVTNPYSYMNASIVAATEGTNATLTNPNGTVANLLGRMQITGTNNLNLQNAVINGENYLSIFCTNNFMGSQGAQIAAPYSDVRVGSPTGQLNITNLLESAIPQWSGNIQAWSTRWLSVDATGVTNDFRVLIVSSQLQPTTLPWVQNLNLYTTNQLTISDVLNVYSSFFTTAKALTVTTNGFGFGASSPEGELNTIFPGNLGPAQWPNLSLVTNNGTLGALGDIIFTNNSPAGTGSPYGAVVNSGVINDQGTIIWATNFLDYGTISNGIGGLSVRSQTSTLTNATIYAGGNVSLAAGSLLVSNVMMQTLSLTLNPTNYLSDGGVTNGNDWTVGRTNGSGGLGFALLNNPANGDLLGTTITNICPPSNKLDANTWAGRDFGAVNAGFTNNAALGHLVLNVAGASSLITFNGTGGAGVSNALYVDLLEFQGTLTNGITSSYNFTNWLALNPNLTIYFGQALVNGVSIAEKINEASLHSGYNGGVATTNGVVLQPGRLRWVPTYAGYLSSTNFVVNGVTNYYNAALAESKDIDSNGNGTPNASDSSPFFTAQQLNFSLMVTNSPVRAAALTWETTPLATNYVYYSSVLPATNWQVFTNFVSSNVTGPAYPVTVTDTNVWKGIRFYKVTVQPWLTYPQ